MTRSSSRLSPRLSRRRRALISLTAVAAVVVLLTGSELPGTLGGFIPKITNNTNNAATAPAFTCKAAATTDTAGKAWFVYPLGESAGRIADDESGSSRDGYYSAGGVDYGQPNPAASGSCKRDKRTVVILNGLTGSIAGPDVTQDNPTVFSTEIWFKTNQHQGKLIGFGNNRTTSSSANNYDRHMYIDENGLLRFGVYPNSTVGRYTIATQSRVDNDVWHHAVATLSSSGMALYLDGNLAKSDSSVTTARDYVGYWRIGWDDLTLWPDKDSERFEGSLAFAAVYTTALTATQVRTHYRAGI